GWKVARRLRGIRKKWISGGMVGIAVVLVFMWDEVLGRMYFHFLCRSQSGSKVYRQVVLPGEYWRSDGSPVFLDENGNKIFSKLDERFIFGRSGEQQISRLFRIKRYDEYVSDRSTNEVLGADTAFHYFGGWVVNNFSVDVSGIHCPVQSREYSM